MNEPHTSDNLSTLHGIVSAPNWVIQIIGNIMLSLIWQLISDEESLMVFRNTYK